MIHKDIPHALLSALDDETDDDNNTNLPCMSLLINDLKETYSINETAKLNNVF